MPAGLYWIDGPWPGKLAVAARPRGGENWPSLRARAGETGWRMTLAIGSVLAWSQFCHF